MTAVERLLATARAEIGYLEKKSNSQLDDKTANAGSNNWTKYARDLDGIGNIYNGKKNGYDWCDVFADWCYITTFGVELGMALTCQSYKGLGAGCKYSRQYYANKGQLVNSPQPGDQIFFGDSSSIWHTGIVEKVANGKVYTIEGNTSGASGVISNGGGVAAKSYPLGSSYIRGYGRPDWSLVKEPEPTPEPEKPEQEEDDDMDISKLTDAQVLELWNRILVITGKQEPSDWSKEERAWAEDEGLIKGDGTGGKQYMAPTTREQLMTFLYRFKDMV